MDINQDDIDKLLQGALVGGGDDPAPASAPAPDASGGSAEPDYSGVASQDDIDALFAAIGDDDSDAPGGEPTGSASPVKETAPEPVAPAAAAPAEPELDLSGVADQDDIDALFAAVGGGSESEPAAAADATEPEPVAAESPAQDTAADIDLDGVADQNDIDALFSAIGSTSTEPAPEPVAEEAAPDIPAEAEPESTPEPEPELVAEEAVLPETEGPLESMEEATVSDAASEDPEAELDALLSSISDGGEEEQDAVAQTDDASDEFDMDELLRQVSEAAPPPPPPPQASVPTPDMAEMETAETEILPSPDFNSAGQDEVDADIDAFAEPEASFEAFQAESAPLPAPAPQQPTYSAPAVSPAPMQPLPDGIPGVPTGTAPSAPRREFSVLYGAGDVESVANQINSLLNSMSEKAHGYMQSWIAADSEAKELRSRALAEERRRISLESEKQALSKQVDEMRTRLSELEGGKIATEEATRTLETSYKTKLRELENRVSLVTAEAETLKDELTRSRNQATGVDIESRRVRFELDRLKSEVESERMERLRIQRALENREKEIQAMQAQAGGQASSLFIDELHRLVRRLETELDARSSGAHEALKQLDRLEVSEDMVPVASNLRAALQHALGQDSDPNDALKSLGREASGIRGGAAITPQKAEILSFETALSTYNLTGSVDIAGTLLREAVATPSALMRKIYQNPALRRPEIGDHLVSLTRLLEGLRTVQESNDRSRGVESGDSEVFYVHMFDYLHNLVRLKLITRMSGDIWRLFLDLRGRFSFVTSDKQWAEYRDNTLRDRNPK